MAIDLTIGLAGSGGDGVILLGELLARASARMGLHATLFKSFGPQIRGGESSARLRVSDQQLSGVDHRLDALLLFHWADVMPFRSELPVAPGTQVFVEAADETLLDDSALPEVVRAKAIRVPLEELAITQVRNKQAKNMVLCGVVAEYYGWPKAALREAIAQRFARHGEAVIAGNQLAVKAGRNWVRENLRVGQPLIDLDEGSTEPPKAMYFLSGNEAFSLGALHAGCRFMAGYPISPASEILEWMTRQLPRFGGTCVQAEDEIAAVCMAIGASFGGARVLTATSGPGFSLKQEAIGLAHMAELPLVVCDVQRCGPSTGIPTRTEQADLFIAIHGGHGDNPRVVLAATSVADCYELAHAAFAIAEKYQTPVIVLLDQMISQSQQTVEELNLRALDSMAGAQLARTAIEPANIEECRAGGNLTAPFKRYTITPSGVSPRPLPGEIGGEYVAVGIEHDEVSDPTSSQEMHQAQTEKRFRKLEAAAAEFPLVKLSGEMPAQLGLLTWGSSYGVCVEAARILTQCGLPTSVLAPQLLSPVPAQPINGWLASVGKVAVVELNFASQLYRHLRGYVDLPADALRLSRAGGTPIGLAELLAFVRDNVALPADFNHARIAYVLEGGQA